MYPFPTVTWACQAFTLIDNYMLLFPSRYECAGCFVQFRTCLRYTFLDHELRNCINMIEASRTTFSVSPFFLFPSPDFYPLVSQFVPFYLWFFVHYPNCSLLFLNFCVKNLAWILFDSCLYLYFRALEIFKLSRRT